MGIRHLLTSLAVWGALFFPGHALALGTRDSAALAAMKGLAGGRTGLVVWESPRTGPWRIFACGLDGSNLRQLTPDVSGQDHVAATISPDGTRVVYYQTPTLTEPAFYADHVGAMMMVDAGATKGNATLLLPEVRTYFEHRFVRWIDDHTIAYIGKDHATYVYSLSDKKSIKLFDYPLAKWGAIPNRQLTYAIDGKNRVFEIQGNQAIQKLAYDGCQGNMSDDGRWAYRVRGGPHDFIRMKLGSWINEVILPNHDSALPASQNYIYFPHVSRCQRYLALGASANLQNHYTADYDIFVIPIDPSTFQKTGGAAR